MGTTALRQLLKSFCTNLPWNYAVLWKLRHETAMILSWEDGYCDYPKLRESVELISKDFYSPGDNGIVSSYHETNVHDSNSGGYPIGQVVANMSHLQYNQGEGVVGKVANVGNHFWVIYDNVSTSKVNSKLVPECPEEWLLQLASGIKTILLVPVLPHGVVQLGSLEVVTEDLAVIEYIKDRFALHNAGTDTVSFRLNRDIRTNSSPTLVSGLHEPSASTISPLKSEDSDTVDSVKPNKIMLSTLDQVVPLLSFQDAPQVSGKDLSGIFESEIEDKIDTPPACFGEVSRLLGDFIDAGELDMVESKLFELSCLEEELETYFQCNNCSVEVLGDLYGGTMKTSSVGYTTEQLFEDKISSSSVHRSPASCLSFPKHCELHKALGPVFQKQTNEYSWDSSFSVDNTSISSSLVGNKDLANGIQSTEFTKAGIAESLLEAVVANVYCGSDENSDVFNSVKSSLTSLEQLLSSPPQSQSEASALVGDDSVPQSQLTSSYVAGSRNEFTPTSASFKSMMGTFTDKEQLEKGYTFTQPRKGVKPSTISKRRAKLGDNQRPRPRDRQLIQDRLKELRELVPNGIKCSIDGLLDRTIKHVLYLRNVTDQAEKLRQWVHHEVTTRKDLKSGETKDSNHSGTTWAFELGNELLVCPIVVEDLAYPGHMLIEMLCNEQGLFLEIAQVIRSSHLTILKGVMESRSHNTWAHFIVEASKGFHRTDIFWPLMHLLQRKRNPISSKI